MTVSSRVDQESSERGERGDGDPPAPPLKPPMKLRHKRIDNGAQCALYLDVRVFADLLHEHMKTRRLIVVILISLTNLLHCLRQYLSCDWLV